MKATAALRGPLNLGLDLCRPGNRRHAAIARLRALRHRATWRLWRAMLRRRRSGRPMILIGMVEHFGDIVAAEPIARHLRRENPDAYIVWAVKRDYRELIDHNPHVDAALEVRCMSEWVHMAGRLPFDRVVDLHVPGRLCSICNYAQKRSPGGDPAINLTNYLNHGNLLGVFCKCAGLPVMDEGPRVYIPPAAARNVDGLGLPGRFVAVHCTSNQDVRDWTTPKWNELVPRLVDATGLSVVEIGLKPVVQGSPRGYVNLCGRLSLLETAEVIRRAELFVGVESGPAHLANAVGTYGIILSGHYRSYPRYMVYSGDYANGRNAHVIQYDGPAAAIPVEHVLDLVTQRLRHAKGQAA